MTKAASDKSDNNDETETPRELTLPNGEGVKVRVITDFTPTEIIEAVAPPSVQDEVREVRAFYIDKVPDAEIDDFDMRPVIFPADAEIDAVPKDSSVIVPADSLGLTKTTEV